MNGEGSASPEPSSGRDGARPKGLSAHSADSA